MSDIYNPFKKSTSTWVVKFIIQYQYIAIFEHYVSEISSSISYFEYEASPSYESLSNDKWIFEAYFNEKPDDNIIRSIIDSTSRDIDIASPKYSVEELEDKDWVTEVQKNSKSFAVRDFYIHNSNYKDDENYKYNITIDASRAFGTGEHETTSGCVEALSILSKKHNFKNMLDIGCGTGILAISMAKIWQGSIIATDIDEIAVSISKENALINNVGQYINFQVADGYRSDTINRHSQYDLITANILAKPLIELAPDLTKNLKLGGIAVLSGLISNQEQDVINAHISEGLKLIDIIRRNNWSILILTK